MASLPPPVVTLSIPVLGWYTVQFGGIQTSQFLSVPNASYLSSPDGINTGLVGTQDGAIAHLAGIRTTNDGGQNNIMWVAASLALADGFTIFNPYPSPNTPGRWLAQLIPVAQISRIIVSGTTIQLAPATSLCIVRKQVPSLTTILLPTMATAILGQPVTIKAGDIPGGNGQWVSSFPITITNLDGAAIDSGTSLVINHPFGAVTLNPDGVVWNRE